MYNINMKEKTLQIKTLYFSTREIEALQKEAEEKTITFSEAVRRAIDFYLDHKKHKNESSKNI